MNTPLAPTFSRLDLPFTSQAPATAREQLRLFAGHLPDVTVDDAVVMVSELVTNALVHGRPEITLRLWLTADRLTVAVADLGESMLACAVPRLQQASGRGLIIVDALATRWGVSWPSRRVGKQVWFELQPAT